ncbi:conserved hypothetical protein [Ixodes scapularis]|uniref:t-SNARE coiled-coil homology domain-containing protein n=1 Tax=Ixodes scapularis TaxID=6945 RepID=B7PPK1_IXOSC|nr:conserved hypothetical protein [Ixodes scapularis]|eukprot:XP_002435693.1 conserved hypothetical protein [Ixodes scapularis]
MVEPSVPADERDEDRFLRELRRIQAEQDDDDLQEEVWDPSVAATRKMLQVCQAAQGVGLKTVATLDEQGEQLNHVGRSLGDITRDLDSVEEDLSKGMGQQLTGQNDQITALTASASSSTERLARASESAETILRDG